MSTMSIRLPNSLHQRLREFAARDSISINQLISTAVAEKLAALSTVEYLRSRAERGNRAAFEEVLARVPDTEPAPEDRIRPTAREPASTPYRSSRRRPRVAKRQRT